MINVILQVTTTVTQTSQTYTPANPANFLILELIIPILLTACGGIVFFSYHRRKTFALRIFGSKYFTFGVMNPAGMLEWVNRATSDMKIYGSVILWYHKDGAYRVTEDTLFWYNGVPHAMYKFGNPNPLNILGEPDAEISVYDEDLKQNITVKISSQELKGAIESKVVNELNKVGFNRMEIITLIVMVVAIVFNIVILVEVYGVNSSYSTLVQQLNQILKQLASTSTTTPAP
jgi:hypothetical protein